MQYHASLCYLMLAHGFRHPFDVLWRDECTLSFLQQPPLDDYHDDSLVGSTRPRLRPVPAWPSCVTGASSTSFCTTGLFGLSRHRIWLCLVKHNPRPRHSSAGRQPAYGWLSLKDSCSPPTQQYAQVNPLPWPFADDRSGPAGVSSPFALFPLRPPATLCVHLPT